jgi:hypothetical protein
MFLDVWACMLVKGEGKVPFDPEIHDEDKAVTAINMELVPLPEHDVTFTLTRDTVHFAKGWTDITLPSIQAAGVMNLRTLHETHVSVEFEPTGRTWKGNDGETKHETAFVIKDVFESEAACRKAHKAFENEEADDVPFETKDNGNGKSKERETAKAFLKPLWMQSGGDTEKFAQLIEGTPMVSKHFDLESPEVQAVMSA